MPKNRRLIFKHAKSVTVNFLVAFIAFWMNLFKALPPSKENYYVLHYHYTTITMTLMKTPVGNIRGEFYPMFAIKRYLKENDVLRSACSQAKQMGFDTLLYILPVLASKYRYRKVTGQKLDLKNPRNFNEKLQWLKLYWQNPLVVKCADKYGVREYAKDCGCEEILNQLYGVYEHPSEIDWGNLPDKFALKCTHGSGFNIICDDKKKLDKEQTLKQLNEWLKTRYGRQTAEIHYTYIRPRIVCEQYIETDAGLLPIDYKFFCFNGKPELVVVCSDRSSDVRFICANLDWQPMDILTKQCSSEKLPNKPDCLDAMIEYAAKLAQPFPFVRVDFYDFKGKPVLGELTFTPAACMSLYYNETGLQLLGDMLQLPRTYCRG